MKTVKSFYESAKAFEVAFDEVAFLEKVVTRDFLSRSISKDCIQQTIEYCRKLSYLHKQDASKLLSKHIAEFIKENPDTERTIGCLLKTVFVIEILTVDKECSLLTETLDNLCKHLFSIPNLPALQRVLSIMPLNESIKEITIQSFKRIIESSNSYWLHNRWSQMRYIANLFFCLFYYLLIHSYQTYKQQQYFQVT